MTIVPPGARLGNRDAALMNQGPNQPSAQQLQLAAQQQAAMEQARASAQLPQAISGAQRELSARDQQASDMAYRAKQAVQALAGPDALPGQAGVLAMAAQAPEGVDPRLAILRDIGMA